MNEKKTESSDKKVKRGRRRIYQEPIEENAIVKVEIAEVFEEPPSKDLIRKGERITTKYVHLSAGFGLIPFPLLDFASIIALQTLMVAKLAALWGVPFSKNRDKSLLMSLISGLISSSFGAGGIGSFIKMIPVIGQIAGLLAYPVVAGATTYAIGKVFIKHFDSGGTLLDFNPRSVKKYYDDQFEKGKEVVSNLKTK